MLIKKYCNEKDDVEEEQTATIPTDIPNRYIGIDLKFMLNNEAPYLKKKNFFKTKEEALEYLKK